MKKTFLLLLSLYLNIALAVEDGFDYQSVTPPVPVQNQTSGRVEVVEMFWYGCPHCLHFEPVINNWARQKPSNVDFFRIPAIFRDSWESLARAFYTAEALGVLDRIHPALFKAIQEQRRKLDTAQEIRTFFAEHGVPSSDFDQVFNSFGIETKIRRAKDLTRRYGIDGVPAVIVQGKYRTNGTLTGGLENVPPVIDALIQRELGTPTKKD